jgi:hypothetical protein
MSTNGPPREQGIGDATFYEQPSCYPDPVDEFTQSCQSNNFAFFSQASGVATKLRCPLLCKVKMSLGSF